MTRALVDFKAAVLRTGLVHEPIQITLQATEGVAQIAVPLAGNGSDGVSLQALQSLRQRVFPTTLGAVPGTKAYVGGDLAFSEDFNAQLRSSIAPVVIFVLVLAFLVMLVSFHSITIAAVSVLLNVLSMAAALGVMVAVFQHGWGVSLIGTRSVGAIESWLPLFAFVILFGLSTDYPVFGVFRIREAHDAGMTTRDAVEYGLRISAGVVTSAAIIMVAVFAVLATLSMQTFKQLGVGLAVAILLDATIVRVVLLPSILTLLGERTWYLPSWLSFLPKSPHPDTAQAPLTAAGAEPQSPAGQRQTPADLTPR